MDIYFFKKALPIFQECIGLPQKGCNRPSAAGGGGVDGNDKFPYLLTLPVFQRLDQGQISIMFQPVGIVNIIEFFLA